MFVGRFSKTVVSMLAAAVVATALVGCSEECDCGENGGGGGSGGEKTLIVQNVPSDVFALGSSQGGRLGLFPVGTSPQQAQSMTGLVAGAYFGDITTVVGSGPYTLTIPLYTNEGIGNRWRGSGRYDLFVEVGGLRYFRIGSINISSGTTTISFSSATEVYL